MDAHVAKPINMETLLERISHCLPVAPQSEHTAPNLAEECRAPSLPTHLPGIDMVAGLARLDGNLPLFLKVLTRFRDSLGRQFETQFREARAVDDWEAASRHAHSLKGVAMTLGTLDLGETADELEHALNIRDAGRSDALTPEVLHHLARVMNGLDQFDGGVAPTLAITTPQPHPN